MKVAPLSVVTLEYTVTDEHGEVIDTTVGKEPLVYLHGTRYLVSGLEAELEGRSVGEAFDVTLTPNQAYGEYDENLDLGVPLDAFPEEDRESIKPGVMFAAPHPSDEDVEVLFRVVGVEDGTAYVSGNHPMAGQALHFEVDIIEVRKPTAEELAHEHVHGEGCCHD